MCWRGSAARGSRYSGRRPPRRRASKDVVKMRENVGPRILMTLGCLVVKESGMREP